MKSGIQIKDQVNAIQDVDLRNIKSTLVVMYCGRSGSFLFSNLMDHHPEVLSCPPGSLSHTISHIARIFTNLMKNPNTFSPEFLIEELILDHPNLFLETNRNNYIGNTEEKKYSGVPRELFRAISKKLLEQHLMKTHGPLIINDIFSLIHWAYALSAGRKIRTAAPTICWQRHALILNNSVEFFDRCLSNPIYITAIRRFEDALDSHLSRMSIELDVNGEPLNNNKHDYCATYVSQFMFNLLRKPSSNRHYAIKFEDMHMHTYEIMNSVCEVLDINYDPILLETTLDGEQYHFEKVPGQFTTGVNLDLQKKSVFDFLNDSDVLLLNLILRRSYIDYGYEFSDQFVNKLGLDPNENISSATIMHFVNQKSLFNSSYMIDTLLNIEGYAYLPKILEMFDKHKPIELINKNKFHESKVIFENKAHSQTSSQFPPSSQNMGYI